MITNRFPELLEKLREISYLRSVLGLLSWDEQVYMPAKAAEQRGASTAYLRGLQHEKFLDLNKDGLLDELEKQIDSPDFTAEEQAIIREVLRDYRREQKLPLEFVQHVARLTCKAHHIWAEARAKANYSLFAPCLKELVDTYRKRAEYLGYEESPYDALIEDFEPGMTAKRLAELFAPLKDQLVTIVQQIQQSPAKVDSNLIRGHFPTATQMTFNEQVAQQIGFDFSAGRLDASVHPFTEGFHPDDVRITTRYDEQDLMYALLATVHEVGHALYEQGVKPEYAATPLGEIVSYGIHESQSMIWEKPVGKGKAFWHYFYPQLQQHFSEPFGQMPFDDFYRHLNCVEPSLIRTEADEVTYILHIILRFEIERDLIEGTLSVEEAPAVWNQKVKDYLGIDMPNDAVGILQDVHWSSGYFGYFPSYALGSLYAIQLYDAAKRQLPTLEDDFAAGRFIAFREWLREKIHQFGRFHGPEALIAETTGEAPSPQCFLDYIQEKYSEIYDLKN